MNRSTESSKLFRAKIFHAKWRGCLPALGAALVVTLFVVFALMPMSEPGGSYESSINQALHATATPIETDSYLLRPFAWISSSLVVVLLFIITIIVSIHIVLQEIKRKSVAVPLLLLAFLTGYAGVAFYGEQTLIEWPLSRSSPSNKLYQSPLLQPVWTGSPFGKQICSSLRCVL